MCIGGAGGDDGRVPIKALMSGQDVGAVNRLPMFPGSRILPSYEKMSRQVSAKAVLSAKMRARLTESHGTGHAFLYPAKPCQRSADVVRAGLPWQPGASEPLSFVEGDGLDEVVLAVVTFFFLLLLLALITSICTVKNGRRGIWTSGGSHSGGKAPSSTLNTRQHSQTQGKQPDPSPNSEH
jgi:hypothetical protein